MTTYAELSDAEKARLDAETDGASRNPGFNYEAHVAATSGSASTTGSDTASPEANNPKDGQTSGGSTEPVSGSPADSNVDTSRMSEPVAKLTDAQRADLFAQVGNVMYNPNWSLAGHIAGNMKDGVFVAPSFESGKDAPNPDASLDWGKLAGDLGINLKRWEPETTSSAALSETDKARLGEKLARVENISSEVASLSEGLKADLYAQVGDAMYSPGFNLAAHIAANMDGGVFVPPSADSSSPLNDGGNWAEWISTNDTKLVSWTATTVKVPIISGNAVLLALPAEGSAEWDKLFEETGGASANPGFNYAAHIAAVTSQNILTGLTEDDVLKLVKETGRTDFKNFDLNAHEEMKTNSVGLLKNKLLTKEADLSAEISIFGSESNDRIDLREIKEKKFIATGAGNDYILAGTDGNVIVAGTGDDFIDGGEGTDSVVINDEFINTAVSFDELLGEWVVISEGDGRDTLTDIERIVFSDKSLAVDINGDAGFTAKLLGAVFGSESVANPDFVGIGLSLLDAGTSYSDLASLAMTAAGKTTAADVCSLLWENIAGVAATPEDIAPFVQMLEGNEITVAQLTTLAADTALNQSNVNFLGLSTTGIEYTSTVA